MYIPSILVCLLNWSNLICHPSVCRDTYTPPHSLFMQFINCSDSILVEGHKNSVFYHYIKLI